SRTSSGRCPTAAPIGRATIGSSACCAWATAGTPITTAFHGVPDTAWSLGSGTQAGKSSPRSRRCAWRATCACRRPSKSCGRAPPRWRRAVPTQPEPATAPPVAAPPAGDDFVAQLGTVAHDRRDPDQWWALYTDRSLPLDPQVKAALVLDARSFSRRVLLPLLRPLARCLLIFVGLCRTLVPRALTSSTLLHRLIYFGLRHFVSPQANFLILRHFHLGSNVVGFLAANSGTGVATLPLRPLEPADVEDHLFLQHDLNLYNFVISLNAELNTQGRGLSPPARIDFDAIDETPIAFPRFPRWPLNFLDSISAIELYTPLYHLLLGQRDFARANQSLQLDETVGIYAAQVLGATTHLALINNHHPWVPLSSLRAGHRLVLHGLGTETLHAVLVQHKRAAAARHTRGSAQARGRRGRRRARRRRSGRRRRGLRPAEPLARARPEVTALAGVHVERLPLALV